MFSRSNSEYFCTFWTTSASSPRHPNEHLQKPTHTSKVVLFIFKKLNRRANPFFLVLTFFFLKNNHKTIDRGWRCLSEIQQGMKWLFFWRCEKLCVYFYSTYISSKYHKNFVVCLNEIQIILFDIYNDKFWTS